jgi:type II secretory pathway pseudopilin PulG
MNRQNESGRSMIEIIGVMAIMGVITAGAIAMYNSVRNRQIRMIAAEDLKSLAQGAKLIYQGRGDYAGISVEKMVEYRVLKNNKAPIGNQENYSVRSENLGKEFLISLGGLSAGDCAYFATVNLDWAAAVRVNGFESDPKAYCMRGGANQVSFVVK